MTFSRFFGFGFVLWILLALLKGWFLNTLNFSLIYIQFVFLILVFIVSLGCSRRLGVINYLEGASVAVLWTLGVVFGDLIFLRAIFLWPVFSHLSIFVSYLVTGLAIFFFHKKRHIQIRKELAAHHGHH